MGFRPMPEGSEEGSSIVWYQARNKTNINIWMNSFNNFLAPLLWEQAGVSFMVKRKHGRRIIHCEVISERLMRVKPDYLGRKIAVFGLYAPGNNETPDVKDAFVVNLRATLEKVYDNEIILLGDFNARVGWG
ncbi:unnamed protein product [Nezara viridula]|uniref:Craniofacial development protein 2-like n=1 Tax=Nezara viridula TaxID=85310 RepID=A0A9P0MMD5_NEZVI|nr:unnamed protein product [Nezara viridula]